MNPSVSSLFPLTWLAVAGSVLFVVEQAATLATPKPVGHALLVGVTDYPNLSKNLWLEGGRNDVLLIKHMLVSKFGFTGKNITILSEAEGKTDAQRLPTRANIEREVKSLAARVQKGDRVVVSLAGHGSWMPEAPDTKEPAPDGCEKLFLPRDVKGFDRHAGAVPNAISGRELGAWLRPVAEKKATLWVIVDACHSGGGVRAVGGLGEKRRQLNPEIDLQIPAARLKEASERARKQASSGTAQAIRGPLARLDGVAILYACGPLEQTPETTLPYPETGEPARFGLLTHTLCCALLVANEPLSYRELLIRVQNLYKANERDWPRPLIHGAAQNQVVLGETSLEGSTLTVTQHQGKLTLNGGQLHGLTHGTILSVGPPAGTKGALRGHVEITRLGLTRSQVIPVEFAQLKAPAEMDIVDGRCEVVELIIDMKVTIAVHKDGPQPARDELAKSLRQLAQEKASSVEYVEEPARADWLVRLDEGKAYLLPRSEWYDEREAKQRRQIGPAPEGNERVKWFRSAFAKIARVLNLLRLAAHKMPRGEEEFPLRVETVIERVGARKSDQSESATIPTFYHGDEVRFRIHNRSRTPVDVTILYVNSQFGITPLLPLKYESNRVEPGKSLTMPPVDIDAETFGREHVVVIAVQADGELTDFVALSQPDIHAVEKEARKRGNRARGIKSPLGRLLLEAMHPTGGPSRNVRQREIENFCAQLIPVEIVAGKRPEVK